jgi:hypothetical protein
MHDYMSTQYRVANQAATGDKAGRPMRSMIRIHRLLALIYAGSKETLVSFSGVAQAY